MSGVEDFNVPLFNETAKKWREVGWEVFNPAESFDGRTDLPRHEYMRADINALVSCDALVVLPGWEQSEGAKLEMLVAEAMALPIYDARYRATFNGGLRPLERLRDEFRDELEAMYQLHAAKRSDYTGDGADLLANYRFSSMLVGLPIHMGMLMRLGEKIYRLKSIFEKGGGVQVKDEGVTDTLRDISIIAILMKLALQGGRYSEPPRSEA